MALTGPLEAVRQMFANSTFTQMWGRTQWENFHPGIDFVIPGGERANVLSPVSGQVIRSGFQNDGYGNSVWIKAPNKYTYFVGHLSQQPRVRAGQFVYAGDVLGYQGHTGHVIGNPGTHVHLGILDDKGNQVDPAGVFSPNDTKAWTRVWWTLYHGMGLGAGFNPNQLQSPPDPTVTLQGTPYETAKWFTTLTGSKYPSSGSTSVDDGGTTNGGTSGGSSDVCGPAPAITDPVAYGNWLACHANVFNQIQNATHGWNLGGYLQSDVVPPLFIFSVVAVPVKKNILKITREKPVQSVVQPVVEVGKGTAELVATRGVSKVAGKATIKVAAKVPTPAKVTA